MQNSSVQLSCKGLHIFAASWEKTAEQGRSDPQIDHMPSGCASQKRMIVGVLALFASPQRGVTTVVTSICKRPIENIPASRVE
jgi:hypothetical protein